MSSDDDDAPGRGAGVGQALTIGAVLAALTAATGAPIDQVMLAALGSGGAAGFVDWIHGLARDELDADLKVWFRNLWTNLDSAEVREGVARRLGEPKARRVVWESVRAVADRIDPAVVPALGALAGEYLRDDRGPDWFLRGASRMLAELSAEELEALRGLVRQVVEAPQAGLLRLEFRHPPAGPEVPPDRPAPDEGPTLCNIGVIEVNREGGYSQGANGVLPSPVAHPNRLNSVLLSHGLAREYGSIGAIRIDKSTVECLHRVIG